MERPSDKLFISYQRDSAGVALRLRDSLAEAGHPVWVDTEQIRHGDRWPVVVHRALEDADRIVLLLTRKATESVEVFNEWFYFYQHRKPLHVIVLDDCRPHYQLLPFQRLNWAGRTDGEWDRLTAQLLAELRGAFEWPRARGDETVITSELAPSRTVSGSIATLAHALRNRGEPVALRPEQLHEIQLHNAFDLREYYLTCYARWCGPQHMLDRRFVRLTLVYDEGTTSPDRWVTLPSTRETDDLGQILTSAGSFAYVLLGAPGSGKSTLLHRLEMDVARQALAADPNVSPVPFSVTLAEYGLGTNTPMPDPLEWLEQRWVARNPHLPALRQLLDSGRLLLLVDGLNEIAHFDAADLRRRIAAWRAFLYERIRDVPGNCAVFACRTLDYGAMLSTKDVGVPHIRLEPMTREQVVSYIDRHLPEQAAVVRDALLHDERTFSFYRTPYMLRLLVNHVQALGTVPVGRADMFTAMIRELLRREILSGNQRVADPDMLTEREQRRLRAGVRDPLWLPAGGQLIPALTRLAYQMQTTKQGHDKGSVVVDYDTAVELLNGLAHVAEASLHAGFDTGILDEHEETIRFFHQLLQEFFAARQLSTATELPQVAVTTRADEVTPRLERQLPLLAPGEPLPPLTTTGWEETAVMAAALAPDADAFVRQVLGVNRALAGRCIAAPDVHVSAQVRREVAESLIHGIGDEGEDLRARIAFGHVLGTVVDPRFTRIDSRHGAALLPRFVSIPAGPHRIGAEGTAYPLERPVHRVGLAAFQLAVTPVTNAEYALFIAAGGYQDERWWRTPHARRWLAADGSLGLITQEWIKKRDGLRRRPQLPVQMLAVGTATLAQSVSMVKLTRMTDEQVNDALATVYGRGAPRQPAYWHDSHLNQPAQPVVGVSVYEAEAYCAWLAAVTDTGVRLPSEHEWEAAAGPRLFPYAEQSDLHSANTFELHVRTTVPVGVLPGGVTPQGCHDMSGNVFEWTASEYQPYPYGRDSPASDAGHAVRICRGGSWRHHRMRARSAYRGRGQCFVRNDDLGFRLAR